jgi:hypothetical protein
MTRLVNSVFWHLLFILSYSTQIILKWTSPSISTCTLLCSVTLSFRYITAALVV